MSTTTQHRRHQGGERPAPKMRPGQLAGILLAMQIIQFGTLELYASLGHALAYVAFCAAVDVAAVRVLRRRWERSGR